MKNTILDLTADEVRDYFLQSSKFCTIDLPKYFDFQPLLDNLSTQIGKQKLFDLRNATFEVKDCENVNYKFLTNKDGNFAWRPLQIINPAIYICLVNRIVEHWDVITNRFKEFQSNSKIKCYSIPLETRDDSDQLKTDISANIRNWWEEIEQQSIVLALEYNYVLITDITDCYSSIYTHSIAWALHGKENARNHRKDNPDNRIIGCIIDDIIQSMSYRQTNGIPQGSVLMDFIAEMVLGYADLLLTKEIEKLGFTKDIDYNVLRYRDDYKIFAHTQEDAVMIVKLLSEVLAELNLKLNTQKTVVSNNIIRDVIKPDKSYWNELRREETSLQKQLLLIYLLSEKHPNSGSLSTALSAFIDRLEPITILKDESSLPLISILVNIAYNNPRTYAAVVVCIGKILSIEPDKGKVYEIYHLIQEKFKNKPNVGYWKVWFQRLTIKDDRYNEMWSDEKLCQIAANNNDMHLWNVRWLKIEYQQIFTDNNIFNEDIYNEMPAIPDKCEVQLFGY